MLKNFLLTQAIKSATKNLPADQKEKIQKLVEEKPELVMELATAVQAEVQSGKSMQEAIQAVFEKRGGELKTLFA